MPRNDTTQMQARVKRETPEKLKSLAHYLGYEYGGKGSTGKLFDAIADGKIVLVSAESVGKIL
jgi:hypothetical protein